MSRYKFGPRTEPTEDEGDIMRISDPRHLAEFAALHQLRADWHEPDESGVGAKIIGTHLDNAMGHTVSLRHGEHGEYNVILTRIVETLPGYDTDAEVAVVNLATLLSWAADLGALITHAYAEGQKA